MRAWIAGLITLGCSGSLPGNPRQDFCLDGFDAARRLSVLSAAGEWRDRTNGAASLTFDCSSSAVPLRIVPGLRNPDSGERADGITQGDGEWIALDPEALRFRTTALHELGHWLTGYAHSGDPTDVMFADDNDQRSSSLTEADVARFH